MNTFRQHAEEAFASGTGFERVGELLADDVVFSSPVVYSPYEGRPIVAAILRGVARVFEDFRYVSSIEEENRSALVFRTRVGDTEIHGVDLITTNDDGLITDFTVMVRPQSGALALKEAMGAQFERIQAEAIAEMQQQAPEQAQQ